MIEMGIQNFGRKPLKGKAHLEGLIKMDLGEMGEGVNRIHLARD
jgi:hypothetical protein